MLVNRNTIQAIWINLKTTFNNAFAAAPSTYQKIAMLVPSTGKQTTYAWLSMFPKMRKWVGEKVVKSLAMFNYTVINDDYEATIEVDRNDIEDDQLGIYGPQAQMAGWAAKQYPDELIYGLVNNGFVNLCYDGQAFFSTAHPVGNEQTGIANVSNKLSGGGSVLAFNTLAAAQSSIGAARVALLKMKNDDGQPLNCQSSILLVPPALADTATALMTADRLGDNSPNPYKGVAEVVIDGRLTSDTAWFLLDTTKPVKPFVYQERKAPVFVEQTDPQADDVFMKRKFKFGVEARGAAGYGFWQLAVGSVGA